MELYKVVATKKGYAAHVSFITAQSADEAVARVKTYHMLPGTRYDRIRAESADSQVADEEIDRIERPLRHGR